MAIRLNTHAYEHARRLIEEGDAVLDGRDQWSEHRPSPKEESEFIAAHGIGEYQKWYLGVDEQENENRQARYKFPFGDFDSVHQCSVLSAHLGAVQYRHREIEIAANDLQSMLNQSDREARS